MLNLAERYIFNGQSIAWGSQGSGAPVVFVHGFPWSAQSWRTIVPQVARNRQVYFFDMLGCGQSEMSEHQSVSENVQSDLLQALIEHWELDKPHIVAHDFGGLAALRGHFVNGVAYSKLHLINSVALLPSGSPFYTHVKQHWEAFSGLPDYAHEALFRAYIQRAAHFPLREESVRTYFKPWSGRTGKSAFYRQIAHSDLANIESAQRLYAPPPFNVHISWGMEDNFIPHSRGRKLADLLGAHSFETIANAAHLVQEDAPEALVGHILATLKT